MLGDGPARAIGRAAAAVRVAARTVLPVDTNPVPGDWRHVTKVDPEAVKRLPIVYPLYLGHTDAVSVGGSSDVTPENTELTFEYLRRAPTPAFHEPSSPEHVTDHTSAVAEFVAVPEVLNGDLESLVGKLGGAVDHVRADVAPAMVERRFPDLPGVLQSALAEWGTSWLLESAVFEAYIIQNPDSAAAREAGVGPGDVVDAPTARRRSLAAERHLGSEVVYVEYSGTYGGETAAEICASVDDALRWSRLWYGGGIDSRRAAERMLEAGADAVVVGDAFHAVAEREAALRREAEAVLAPDADPETVRSWVADRVDADDPAAKYLATIPDVPDPVGTAAAYLAVAVLLDRGVERAAADLGSDPSRRDVAAVLDDPPAGDALARALGDRGRAFARAVSLSLLSHYREDAETTVEGGLPPDHLAVEPREDTDPDPDPEPEAEPEPS